MLGLRPPKWPLSGPKRAKNSTQVVARTCDAGPPSAAVSARQRRRREKNVGTTDGGRTGGGEPRREAAVAGRTAACFRGFGGRYGWTRATVAKRRRRASFPPRTVWERRRGLSFRRAPWCLLRAPCVFSRVRTCLRARPSREPRKQHASEVRRSLSPRVPCSPTQGRPVRRSKPSACAAHRASPGRTASARRPHRRRRSRYRVPPPRTALPSGRTARTLRCTVRKGNVRAGQTVRREKPSGTFFLRQTVRREKPSGTLFCADGGG